MSELSKVDWERMKFYTRPEAFKDLDKFLDKLPERTGKIALYGAAVSWIIAGATLVYTMTQINRANEIRTNILKIEAAKPLVPVIKKQPVSDIELEEFVGRASKNYRNLDMQVKERGIVEISAPETRFYSDFQSAINHVQFGGHQWQTTVDRLCVGRECSAAKLLISLRVSKVSIEETES